MDSKHIFYHFASLKRLLTEADKKLLKEHEDSLEKKTNPKPDILEQAMNYIYDSNLQILLDEITDLKTRIESLEHQIIQIIVIPLEIPCVKCQCSCCCNK